MDRGLHSTFESVGLPKMYPYTQDEAKQPSSFRKLFASAKAPIARIPALDFMTRTP